MTNEQRISHYIEKIGDRRTSNGAEWLARFWLSIERRTSLPTSKYPKKTMEDCFVEWNKSNVDGKIEEHF